VHKRSMNSNGHGMMVALVILATRGPLRGSEGRAHRDLSLPEIFKREQPGKGNNHIVE
jgi:hypothetical protein